MNEAGDEGFRNRLAEWIEVESLLGDPVDPIDTMKQRDGVDMTQSDRQRETVHEALVRLKFQDRDMRFYADAPSFELGDVLNRAKEIVTSTDALPHDKAAAADIVRMIRGFSRSEDDE